MSIEIWLSFVLASLVLCVTPGPTVFFVIGHSLKHGKASVVPMVFGALSGDIVLMCLSFIGLSALLASSVYMFTILKFVGALYLIYLGIKSWRSPSFINQENAMEIFPLKKGKIYTDALLVTALNPKGIIFFTAFFPLFLDVNSALLPQMLILALTFMGVAVSTNSCYSIFSSYLSTKVKSAKTQKMFNKTSGGLLIGAGLITASLQK
ncbi:MAG: LysE family translocator [Campylobacteraceae bacterium]|nr:LysE family translocator [Campylobacteraceae bacterium]